MGKKNIDKIMCAQSPQFKHETMNIKRADNLLAAILCQILVCRFFKQSEYSHRVRY